MKKLFLSTLLLALPLLASAYDVEVAGVYYNLIPKGNQAEVTYHRYSGGLSPYYLSDYSGSVNIPEKFTFENVEYSVTSIGEYAFYLCSSLTSVHFPSTLSTISDNAFSGCRSLSSVDFPNSVKSIGENAFSGCHSLKSLTIPNSVTSIANHAFTACSGLTSVFIPNSITNIGEYAFYGCSSLTSITIPNSVTTIGGCAFNGCSSLTSVNIPNSVTTIGNATFSDCKALISVIIPNSVTGIGNSTFSGCSGLTSVSIPNSVKNIGYQAFNGCTSLTSLTIPISVTTIENYAFCTCSGLTSVILPNSVTTIGSQAFSGCSSLTSVTIGSSVKYVNSKAFAECSNLEEVYCLAEKVPSTTPNAFEKSYPAYMTLYVPAKSLNDYKNTEPWSQFGTIKAISGSGEETIKCAIPTINYANKRLIFSCETEGVEYVSEIKDKDVKKYYDSEVNLSASYEISVYATKSGYTNSDVATATLVWTDAIFTVTTPETPTFAKEVKESIPVLISANGGVITVKSEQEGQTVAVYTADGKALGSSTVKDGQATVATNLQRGEIVIVKVGGRSVKVKM